MLPRLSLAYARGSLPGFALRSSLATERGAELKKCFEVNAGTSIQNQYSQAMELVIVFQDHAEMFFLA